MDEKNAFDRQLADEIGHQVGPPRAVDAMSVAQTAKTTNPKWRIRMMFSPTNVFAAGSVAIAVSALLLVTQPFGQVQEVPAPGAAEAMEAPVAFSGTIALVHEKFQAGVTDRVDNVTSTRDEFGGGTSDLSDPRLQGEFSLGVNFDKHWAPGLAVDVWVADKRIENEDGAWQGSTVWAGLPFEGASKATVTTDVLYGEGAYEGLVAIMQSDLDMMDWHWDVEGIILDRELPPVPEGPPAE